MTFINIQWREKETIALVVNVIELWKKKKYIISHPHKSEKNKNRLKPGMEEKFQNITFDQYINIRNRSIAIRL